jgi:hypothetical protein
MPRLLLLLGACFVIAFPIHASADDGDPTRQPTRQPATRRAPAVPRQEQDTASSPANASAGKPGTPAGSSSVQKALAARQDLMARNARLEAKREALKRWDEADQRTFRKVFGNTDEASRDRVLLLIGQQLVRNRQLLAALDDGLRLEVYLGVSDR